MNTTEQILLVILCVLLALFLILSITIGIYVLRVVKSVNRMTEKAEHVVDNAEAATMTFTRAAGQFSLLKTISKFIDTVSNPKKKKK